MNTDNIANYVFIDLSGVQDSAQLVSKLNDYLEQPNMMKKEIALKLGNIDLKQSQLLSIKALIEAMDSKILHIDTTSELTKVSAEELGIVVSEIDNNCPDAAYIEENNEEFFVTQEAPDTETTINERAESIAENFTTTVEGITDTYTEETTSELSEIIGDGSGISASTFASLAISEGLINAEDTSKYILLDNDNLEMGTKKEADIDTKTLPTLYVEQTLRSGQTINYEGNILILGDAHPGSEIIATGDITVWGILGGIAHAGANGNNLAKVRALKLNAIQLRIAGLYARRNDTLNVPYVQKSNEFTPEEAQIEDNRIVIYKKLRRD